MRKVLIFLLLITLLSSFAAAKDFAYIVKTSSNPTIVSILNSSNYSYDIISDAQISATNFSKYAAILVQESVANKNLIPVSSKNSLFLDKNLVASVWGSAWSVYSSTGSYAQIKQLTSPLTNGLSVGQFQAYSSSKNQNYVKRTSIGGAIIYGVAYPLGTSSQLYPIVAYSNTSRRTVFFGFSDISYWSASTKTLFSNSLKWVRLGVDFDGDGYYSDTDCDDSNASKWQLISGYLDSDKDGFGSGSLIQVCSGNSLPAGYSNINGDCNNNNAGINPNAIEIPYNYIDENCDNYDMADVDGDGYCKQDYFVQSKFNQCSSESGNYGTDCDDNNSIFSPGSSDLAKNCRNDAPVFTGSIENITFNEDSTSENTVDLNDYFSDPDGDSLTFSVYNKISSIIINLTQGNVSISAEKDWNGLGFVVFKAQDSSLSNLSNVISVQVISINDAPILENISDIRIVEGHSAVITVNASDVDSTSLNYSINDSRFNQTGNIFSWNTGYGDAGTYYVNVSVSDGYLIYSKQVKIEVIRKIVINEFVSNPEIGNEWIEIYNPGNSSFDLTGCYLEDAAYNHIQLSGSIAGKSFLVKEMSYSVLNNDGDTIRLKCSELLDEIIYGSGGIAVPSQGKSAGRIFDGHDTDSVSDWKIYELPTKGISNSADMIAPLVNLILPLNNSIFNVSSVTFNFTASDNTANSVNCSFFSDVVNKTWKNLASQVLANGTVGNFYMNNAENGNYLWQIKCSDGSNLGISEIRSLRINIPKAPVMNSIANITINETDIARIIINASDSNPEDNLTYSINDSRFNQTGNIFSWQTGYNDGGIYNILVSVSDGNFVTSQIVKVTVLNKNRSPVINNLPFTINTDEDISTSFLVNATDEDNENLSYRVKLKDISKADCIVNNSLITIIPALNFFGLASCIIEVSDSVSSINGTLTVQINAVNDAPILQSINNITVQETENVRIAVNASDVDSTSLNYSINDSRFNQTGNIFSWNTGYGDAGTYYVNVSVSDGLLSDSKTVKVTVVDKNELPYILDIAPRTIEEDSGFTDDIDLAAYDNDGNETISRFEVSYEDTGKVDCTVSDRKLGIKPASNFYGNASCKIRVYDNLNAWDETTLNITVLPVNDAPIITSYSPNFAPVIAEDGSEKFSVSWSDIDNFPVDVIVKWYVNGNYSGVIGNSFDFTAAGDSEYEIKAQVQDKENYTSHSWQLTTSKIPIATSYNGETTNFSEKNDSQLSNIKLILEKIGFGRIEFLDNVDLRDVVDFDNYADIKTGLVALDSGYFTSLAGRLARITLTGLSFPKTPVIYYNSGFTLDKNSINNVCPENVCQNVTYSNGTLSFLSHFSSFKIGETLTCSEQQGNICSSSEICYGTSILAVENNCCLGTCMPAFSDIDKCRNTSSDIEITIKKPDEGEKFSVGDNIPVELKIKNNAGEDMGIEINAYLYDLSDDTQIEDYDTDIDIDSGKSEKVDFNFAIPFDIDEEDDYAIFVVADGDVCNQNYQKIKIERDKHRVDISNFEIPDSAECGSSIETSLRLENTGKKDEVVTLILENSELSINVQSSFNLDNYNEDKNKASRTFILDIPDYIQEKEYTIEARAEYSDKTTSAKKEISIKCEKKQQEISQDTGIIKLESITKPVEVKESSLIVKIGSMDATELTLVIFDIFLGLGIIFIILYLILRK